MFKSCFNLFYLATWGELKTLTLSPYKVAECECVTDAYLHVHGLAPAFTERHIQYLPSFFPFYKPDSKKISKRCYVVEHVNKKRECIQIIC